MTAPEFTTLVLGGDGPVRTLTLDRPDRLNALSAALLTELIAACRWLDDQRDVKVVIVRGAGRAFCAGFDLADFTGDGSGSASETADLGRRATDALSDIRGLTVAALHGHCVGGGVVLATACDLRVAAASTRFSIPEVDLGIPLAWGGIPRLVREIGPAATKELVLTCRPFGAEEARSLGFLNRVVPAEALDAEVAGLADQLASKAALPLRATKRHVDAVTAAMVGTARAWSDADSLLTALRDPESRAAAERYLRGLAERRRGPAPTALATANDPLAME